MATETEVVSCVKTVVPREFRGTIRGEGAPLPGAPDNAAKEQEELAEPPKKLKTSPKRGNPKKKDRFAYLLGSANLCIITFWLGSFPSSFYKLYCVKAVLLLVIRWVSFKKQKMHYYMFDFCYVVNVLLIAHLWFWPQSNFLYKILFAYSCGPLAFSVVMFKNSLVYHSLEQLTSLFIHFYPLVVLWTLRWYPDPNLLDLSQPYWQKATFVELLVWPMLSYLGWAVLYYMKIFVVSSGRIKEREYETLYQWLMARESGIFYRIVNRVDAPYQPLAYMLVHGILVYASLILGLFCWHCFIIHSLVVAITTAASIWNGASYYLS